MIYIPCGSQFWIDFLAAVPIDMIATYGANYEDIDFSILGMLKMTRVFRLNRLIKFLRITDEQRAVLKLAKIVFWLVIYIHLVGWLWFFIVNEDEKWIPPLDTITPGTDLYTRDITYQYLMSIFYSVEMLVGGDILPVGTFQVFWVSMFIFIGAIINASLFGELASLYAVLNRRATIFQERLDTANTAMANLRLPRELRMKVVNFVNSTNTLLETQTEFENFLSIISPSLKQEVIAHIFSKTFKNDEFLEN
jgi:heme/copper-type cytochrome/quinol oxidase subunit 4